MITAFWRAYEGSTVVSYCVHEPPNPPADRYERAEQFLFLKDGFSWSAALYAPFWLLAKGQWLALIGYLLIAFAIVAGLNALGVQPLWIFLCVLALHVLIGAEATSIQRWTLEQRNWNFIGTVVGRNLRDCERRFFDTWFSNQVGSESADQLDAPVFAGVSGNTHQLRPLDRQSENSDRLTERLRQVFANRE